MTSHLQKVATKAAAIETKEDFFSTWESLRKVEYSTNRALYAFCLYTLAEKGAALTARDPADLKLRALASRCAQLSFSS